MASYLTDDAICLRVTDFSETSQVVGMFTRHHGLVPMIAKGSKRDTKKNTMSGPLDLLTSGEVVFVAPGTSKAGGELSLLSKWELANHRTNLRKDLAALNAAMMCAEITTVLMTPHDPHETLYAELDAALDLVGTPPFHQRMRGVVSYAKTALAEAGYGPLLEECIVCGREIGAELVRYVPRAGGVVCSRCEIPRDRGGGPVLEVHGKIAVALERLPRPSTLSTSPPHREADAAALARAMELLLAQIEAVTDRPLRTRRLLPGIFAP